MIKFNRIGYATKFALLGLLGALACLPSAILYGSRAQGSRTSALVPAAFAHAA